MINKSEFAKFLSYTDEEVDRHIEKMSEKEAKETLAKMIKAMNEIDRNRRTYLL